MGEQVSEDERRFFDELTEVIFDELQVQIWTRRLGEIDPPESGIRTTAELIADEVMGVFHLEKRAKLHYPLGPPGERSQAAIRRLVAER
jgi:hypothetical protein